MLTINKVIVVTIASQYMQISNHYIVYLKLIKQYMAVICQLEKKERDFPGHPVDKILGSQCRELGQGTRPHMLKLRSPHTAQKMAQAKNKQQCSLNK